MTDRRSPEPGIDTPIDPDRREPWSDAPRPDKAEREANPLLREGTDAPDAADIEDPERQL